jgi:hypothetical protein
LQALTERVCFATGTTPKHLSNVGANEMKLFVFNSDSEVVVLND